MRIDSNRRLPDEHETIHRAFIEQMLREQITAYDNDLAKDEDEDEDECFFVADMGEVYRKFVLWEENLPRVKPFYAVKCNPDKEVLRLLALLGTGFDCSSRGEIQDILDLDVAADRIIFANPSKNASHIRYAQRKGVRKMTFDGEDELYKIKAIFPGAELILRIITDDSSSLCPFSKKFGAPLNTVGQLLKTARSLELNIIGVSFHIGSAATDPDIFVKAVQDSGKVLNQAREFGFTLKLIDIGGGFSAASFKAMSEPLALALDQCFPGDYSLIAEPGRYFVESAFTLACSIIARRKIWTGGSDGRYMLTLNDGVYGNFMDCLLSGWRREPQILLSNPEGKSKLPIEYSIWGPTCDGVDKIIEDAWFHQLLSIGDWLYFENMGAYSLCLSTCFNGFSSKQVVHHVSSDPAASALLQYNEGRRQSGTTQP